MAALVEVFSGGPFAVPGFEDVDRELVRLDRDAVVRAGSS